ncbi:glycerophosphoryl diester phosphodiesterase [Brevibacterium sanguinis]|uniref:Glycerophosphoryl diester phosphodiesterase n=2 Tax=Brevibacterium TaxID=1696 RepID=A0A366IED4_9MICO|nr:MULTISPECIES: glycerophosphodiester phosphodiesterase family protein [Brevibacterium]RBP61403.1 glycerophosphoryl diester phosphodiesterase [Brevibacterium sanguinis]RBP68486.1 glycerophosphoryl diester phosphodiesterase [Brevibacterium celere]
MSFRQFLLERGYGERPGTATRPLVIAHRGYSAVVPENSLAAVDAARALDVDFIEVDTSTSADGVPIILHDPDLDRTTNRKGPVVNLTAEELSFVDAGSWMGPGFTGIRIPTLGALMRGFQQRGGELLLELKGEWSAGAVARISELVVETGMADRTVVQSFRTETLAACRDLLPMVSRFLLRMVPRPEDIEIARDLGAVAINPSYKGFTMRKSVVSEIRDNDLGVFVWTVDEMNAWRDLLDAGVDGIITNHPGRLQGYLAGCFDPVK